MQQVLLREDQYRNAAFQAGLPSMGYRYLPSCDQPEGRIKDKALHRDLGIPQTIAWHLAHRIRKVWETDHGPYEGPLEIDESYFGGREKNKTESRRGSPKTIVVGARDRACNEIVASVVPDRTRATLAPFINPLLAEGTEVYTDDLMSYRYLPNHEFVKHSIGQYVVDQIHAGASELARACPPRLVAPASEVQ